MHSFCFIPSALGSLPDCFVPFSLPPRTHTVVPIPYTTLAGLVSILVFPLSLCCAEPVRLTFYARFPEAIHISYRLMSLFGDASCHSPSTVFDRQLQRSPFLLSLMYGRHYDVLTSSPTSLWFISSHYAKYPGTCGLVSP